jgi:hypothetical protein
VIHGINLAYSMKLLNLAKLKPSSLQTSDDINGPRSASLIASCSVCSTLTPVSDPSGASLFGGLFVYPLVLRDDVSHSQPAPIALAPLCIGHDGAGQRLVTADLTDRCLFRVVLFAHTLPFASLSIRASCSAPSSPLSNKRSQHLSSIPVSNISRSVPFSSGSAR